MSITPRELRAHFSPRRHTVARRRPSAVAMDIASALMRDAQAYRARLIDHDELGRRDRLHWQRAKALGLATAVMRVLAPYEL